MVKNWKPRFFALIAPGVLVYMETNKARACCRAARPLIAQPRAGPGAHFLHGGQAQRPPGTACQPAPALSHAVPPRQTLRAAAERIVEAAGIQGSLVVVNKVGPP
jgi:hypothetical protein